MKIEEIFDEVANQMRSDLEKARTALKHPGLKGEAFEETFKQFIRDYLPRQLDISTGIIIDSSGNSSRQIDIIVSDSAKTPIFYRNGEIRVIPVECVYSIIEVKAYLDSNELNNIFQNMESVRNLKKISYYKEGGHIRYTNILYGREWEIWPINYYVFAYDSIDLETLAKHIDEEHKTKNLPENSRIDCICALDKGVICNLGPDGKFNALPQPGSSLYAVNTKRSLLLFYTLISNYLNQARLPNFRFIDYLGQLVF
jgi:hypothetical protein